jgi:hypothetical protein
VAVFDLLDCTYVGHSPLFKVYFIHVAKISTHPEEQKTGGMRP